MQCCTQLEKYTVGKVDSQNHKELNPEEMNTIWKSFFHIFSVILFLIDCIEQLDLSLC